MGVFAEPFGSIGRTVLIAESTIGAAFSAPSLRSSTTCFQALDLGTRLQEEVPIGPHYIL